ncbi:hypothetical protein [Tichowtungia aerotolerans]|uniref:Uncharacterized protein n=1 Tax=Tichowtungia aerotolerans TaxID=2697043 RepID=A0A6P1M8H0_9BACT|nr:hypothetical protein [Tichowtungia aerotolerans]QHI68824.1 hypothetical protein GT409_04955 [Tichowtungia aerotolerans]
MQTVRLILAFLALGLYSTAAEVSEEMAKLQDEYKGHMKIWAVEDDEEESSSGREYFLLKFESRQDVRDRHLNYEMHAAIQLTDKKTDQVVYAEATAVPSELPPDDFYADHTKWELKIPFGDMKKPKLTASAIEFGFIRNGQFIPIAVDYDKVDSMEEIVNSSAKEVKPKSFRHSHYAYNEIYD